MPGLFPVSIIVSIMCAESVPEEFITYFQSKYIGIFRGRGPNRKRSTPLFPVDMWNVNARVLSPDSIPRSNNSHEAFNKSMTNSIPRIHPNIWLLITHLKKEETLAQMKRKHYERSDIKTPGKNTQLLMIGYNTSSADMIRTIKLHF